MFVQQAQDQYGLCEYDGGGQQNLPTILIHIARVNSAIGLAACVDYSFMPANAALRCQSNKADRSSCAHDDGVVGADL